MSHMSSFAGELDCQHCFGAHGVDEWPLHGGTVPFCFQKGSGNYSLEVTCPHCGKVWYVVWDEDPGPIGPLNL